MLGVGQVCVDQTFLIVNNKVISKRRHLPLERPKTHTEWSCGPVPFYKTRPIVEGSPCVGLVFVNRRGVQYDVMKLIHFSKEPSQPQTLSVYRGDTVESPTQCINRSSLRFSHFPRKVCLADNSYQMIDRALLNGYYGRHDE